MAPILIWFSHRTGALAAFYDQVTPRTDNYQLVKCLIIFISSSIFPHLPLHFSCNFDWFELLLCIHIAHRSLMILIPFEITIFKSAHLQQKVEFNR